MGSINYNDICSKLSGYGIEVSKSDTTMVELIANGVEEYIKNFCNISSVPPELYYAAVAMCCGTYIKTKLASGQGEDMAGGEVASITEGDVSVSFKDGLSQSEILKETAESLIDIKGELECFRKLRW